MKRAILVHRKDFAAVAALIVLAIVVVVYILQHQPAFTLGQSYYTVDAQFQTAAAVTAGQGQEVEIAGVQVGQVGGVHLQDGRAIVQMKIFKKYEPIYRDATVLLRPRTPLKDMYLSLDPGTSAAGRVEDGGTLPVASTSPDIDFAQILESLDVDARNYLLLLLAGGAQAFQDNGSTDATPSPIAVADLRGIFKRFAPLNRDTLALTKLLATRRRDISASIHGLQEVSQSLGSVQNSLTSLINSSNTNFAAISSQDRNLQDALTLLPGTLSQTSQTLGKVQAFAAQTGPTLQQLLPFAQALAPALNASQPFLKDTTPAIRDQLRPFAIAVQPVARILRPAAAGLARVTPKLTRAIKVLNSLFNTLAFQPRGSEQGYLFWGSWLSHIANSLVSAQDAHGPIIRGSFMATCGTLNLLEVALLPGSPALGPLIALLNAPDWSKIKSSFCPPGGVG